MTLPRPCRESGHYFLPDGSVIYRSLVEPGQWLAFCRGRQSADDRFLTDGPRLCLYATPQEALAAIENEQRRCKR